MKEAALIRTFVKHTNKNLVSTNGNFKQGYATIIPRARMGYESIAHSAFGLMGY